MMCSRVSSLKIYSSSVLKRSRIWGLQPNSRLFSSAGNHKEEPPVLSSVLAELGDRGFLHQCTDYRELDKSLTDTSVKFYLGFDATAKSLHIGSLIQLMILRRFQQAGHQPIVLIGGGTTKIGDPSGKDSSRQMLSEEVIAENVVSISKIFEKFLNFEDSLPNKAILVNNADWLGNIHYIDFLREYGKLFSVNRMLAMDSVKMRLERQQPLSFLEFNYLLLQSYDFIELHRRHGVTLQVGGSDQWGNIVSGVELGRKLLDVKPLFGLTTPLMVTSAGTKMGKSAAGAVWLDKTLVSEFDYWQYWRNVADDDVIRFLKLFTEVPMSKIREFESNFDDNHKNQAKILLADETTRLLHGPDSLHAIHATVKSLFGNGHGPQDLNSLKKFIISASVDFNAKSATNGHIRHTLPDSCTGEKDDNHGVEVDQGIFVVDLLVKTNLAPSKMAARRMISAGAVRVNDGKVLSDQEYVTVGEFSLSTDKKLLKLSSSKKNHVVVELL